MCIGLTWHKKDTVIHMTNQIELFSLSETIIKFEKFFFFTVGNFYIAMDFRRSFKPSERKRSNESMCGETKKKIS